MTQLAQGGNAPLPATTVKLAFDWPTTRGGIDATAYLLTAAGKVRGDSDMVFFNQTSHPSGGAAITAAAPGQAVFQIDTSRLPAEIDKIVFCLTVETAGRTMADFAGAAMAATCGADSISFAPALDGASEAALIFAEVYRRGDAWKIRGVAQGFNGGLEPLARSFGLDVSGNAAPAPAPPPPPPSPPPAAAAPVSLAKITLDKAKPTVSLEKRGSSFGSISVNLNWTTAGGTGLFGKAKPLDLDLGCLFELADGRKGAVQALGGMFGSLDQVPYIALDQDDRTGALSSGETMHINGRNWAQIRRIALFAFIYEGAKDWRQTNGLVTITMPDQPPIEFIMSDGPSGRGFCGLALIENIGGTMKFTRLMEYFVSHREYDEQLGFGMRWKSGSK
ncbi:TerD family protein [Sandarakinorhabdus sp.]|uniref:TerD family protein n=1 Tax=Sandarakinorhabdus sp. TaxID=1916663 RepID=UPI00333FEBDD